VPYLTFSPSNPLVIRFDPNNSVFIGTHNFKLKVTSVDFPTKVRYESFSIQVTTCQLTSLTMDSFQNTVFYQITSPTVSTMTLPLPSVTKTPVTCNQGLTWTVVDASTGTGYPFIQVQNGQVVISSNNPADKGVY